MRRRDATAAGLNSPIRGYPKETSPQCGVCNHPDVDAVDYALVTGEAGGMEVSRGDLSRWIGLSVATIDRHVAHRRPWFDKMREVLKEMGQRAKLMTAREMAQGVYQAAMDHVEVARENGDVSRDLAHLTEPMRIAAGAAEFVGKLTGEVRETPTGNGIGPGGGSVSVIMMPRLEGMGEVRMIPPAPIIDIGGTSGQTKGEECGNRQVSRDECEIRDAGSGGEALHSEGAPGERELSVAGVSEGD